MINFHLITLFPEMFKSLDYGIVGRAQKTDLLKLHFWNPRDYTQNKQARVDDHPYGGGPGMVLQVQPLRAAINAAKAKISLSEKSLETPEKIIEKPKANPKINSNPKVIYLSPQGKLLTQKILTDFALESKNKHIILISGRYEGIDERVIEQDVDEEWSIGNYILSGGELAAMVMIDGIVRLLPGALGDPDSSCQESFNQDLLDYPHYSRPEEIDGQKVPEVLLSGSHQAIERFRLQQSLGKTLLKRPDLLKNRSLNTQEIILLHEFIQKMRKQT